MELRIEHLHLQFFGHNECLHDITLQFGEGVSVLYGQSGCGKTALLKCIAGINAYAQGTITLDEQPIDVGKVGEVGMVFDDLALFARRSLWYNLTYPLRIRKVPKDEWRTILQPHLERWGLGKTLLDNPVYRTSKEVQVRVALARASLTPRKVLLLDNPLGGLRPDERAQLFRTLSCYLHSYAGIVVYATDSVEEVRGLQAPVTVLSNGYLMAAGSTPLQLCTALPCTYVGEHFVPYWQTVAGTLHQGVVHTALGCWQAQYPDVYEDKEVLVGVMPSMLQATPCADGPYRVVNTAWADGKHYSVAANADKQVTIEGSLPLWDNLSIDTVGYAPLYDVNTEMRIDGMKGEKR